MRYQTRTTKMARTAILLSFTLLFHYLEQYMPLVKDLININLSIVFIYICYEYVGYGWGTTLLVLRFVLHGLIVPSPLGMHIAYLGGFYGLISAFVFVHLTIVLKKVFPFIWATLIATFVSTIFMVMFNGIVGFPWFAKALGASWSYDIWMEVWGMNSYWGIIITIYTIGNLVNYGASSILAVAIDKRNLIRKIS